MAVRDPVCTMMVSGGDYEAIHEGVHYAFCSLQCLERFMDRPGLYVGAGGRRAPLRKGGRVRRRRMRLSTSLAPEQAAGMAAALRSMMGVKRVACGGERDVVEITYDLFQATAEQLERRITQLGGRLDDAVGERIKRTYVRYAENCELEDTAPQGRSPR